MGFERRSKYADITPVEDTKYVKDLTLDNLSLDLICRSLVSDPRTVRRGQLLNVKSLLEVIDPETYNIDPDKKERIGFINKGLEARLEYNLTDPEVILAHIDGGILSNTNYKSSGIVGLSTQEIEWLSVMVSEALKYANMYKYVDHMQNVCLKIKTSEFGTKQKSIDEFEHAINEAQNEFRRCRHETTSDIVFSLQDDVFDDAVRTTYNNLASPRRKLVTGMQGLNELLGGGLECGRCYVFFGLPGEGKSTLMLNLINQVKRYNKNYVTKSPGKVPTLVLLTMENLTQESIERIYNIATGRSKMTDTSVEEVIRAMKEDGGLRIDTDTPINIYIKFMPTNSVDTSYLYTLTEDLEDQGMEVIGFFQDYIGRIRSTERYADSRLEYGQVVDEFKVFAELKDIPIVTLSQLNRDASKHIDEGRKNSQSDLVRTLGRSNISESMLILNNIDGGFILAPEETSDKSERYMGIQRIKKRYEASNTEFVYLPFQRGTISLKEDYGTISNYKTTMRTDFGDNGYAPRISPYQCNAVQEMGQVFPAGGDGANIFNARINNGFEELEAAMRNPIPQWPITFKAKQELVWPVNF